jgi:hypothetical protein
MTNHPAFAIASSPGTWRTGRTIASPPICQNASSGTYVAGRNGAVMRAVFDEAGRQHNDAPSVGPQSQTVAKLSELAIDVRQRPAFYIAAAGAVVAAFVLAKIMADVVAEIETLPVLPVLFKLVGAGYTAYFLTNNLMYAERRENLARSVKELFENVTG